MVMPQFIRKHTFILVVSVTPLMLAALVYTLWPIPCGMESCTTQVVQTVPGPGMCDARVLEEACDGIVGTDTMSIVLESHANKKSFTAFVYGRKSSDPSLSRKNVDPTVTWLGKNELEISIDMVSDVEQKLEEVHGVRISYQIGWIEFTEDSRHQPVWHRPVPNENNNR